MIENNNCLLKLTIENMNIEFSGVQKLKKACESKNNPVILQVNGNFLYEERLNVWTHMLGLVMSLFGTMLL